jgi:hypothetical protein
MALDSPAGLVYPALSADGTVLPPLALAAAVAARVGSLRRLRARARRATAWLQPAAGVVLALAGLSDTFTCWLL